LPCAFEKLSFLDGQNWESAAGASLEESFTKEFTVGGVNQGV
jgi:hypothetical protein